jgi:L-ascorbate metabolism protein UlaG (beta-lactamase superfamily)
MRVRWLGHSAFHLTFASTSVPIDPFEDFAAAIATRGMRFGYPVERDLPADLLVVTHEHPDHTGVGSAAGEPHLVRSIAGTFTTPVGPVVAIASEHDDAAGTLRGPNLIVAFDLDGLRVCHFGDFGQSRLRPEQAAAIGRPDLLFLPVGGGPTMAGAQAAAIARELGARWVVPMHYRTEWIDFLEPADGFLAEFADDERRLLDGAAFETGELPSRDRPVAVVPRVTPPEPAPPGS